jgi:hypothetical protein
MTSKNAQLAVLLWRVQCLIDDAVHDVPAGRYREDQFQELSDVLAQLAECCADHAKATVIVDSTPTETRETEDSPNDDQ